MYFFRVIIFEKKDFFWGGGKFGPPNCFSSNMIYITWNAKKKDFFFFFFLVFVFPHLLLPLNKFWSNFGVLISFVMTPIIMSIIFFFVFTPIGLMLRLFNKRPINLKKSNVKSYWVLRTSKDLLKNMKFQF